MTNGLTVSNGSGLISRLSLKELKKLTFMPPSPHTKMQDPDA